MGSSTTDTTTAATTVTATEADERAREIEAQLTDDERFSLVVSIMGTSRGAPWAGGTRGSPRTSPT